MTDPHQSEYELELLMAMRRDSKAPVPSTKRPVQARVASLAAAAIPPASPRKTPGAGPAVAGSPKPKAKKPAAKKPKPKIARPMNSFMVCIPPRAIPPLLVAMLRYGCTRAALYIRALKEVVVA